jgi:hypothetical protein
MLVTLNQVGDVPIFPGSDPIMPRRLVALCVSATVLTAIGPARSQQPTSPPPSQDTPKSIAGQAADDPIARIKEEGTKNSEVMKTLSYLTDVIGPRLTASPNMKRANEWTRDKMKEWGLENAQLEAWGPFGRGWTLTRFSAQLVEPQCVPLIAFPKAWSPGLDGPILADVVWLDVKTEADLEKYKGRLKGAIVLTGPAREVRAQFEPFGTRMTEKDLLALADAPEPGPRGQRRVPPGAGPRTGDPQAPTAQRFRRDPNLMRVQRRIAQFCIDEGAALTADPSSQGDGGTLFVAAASVPQQPRPSQASSTAARANPWDKTAPKLVPQIVVAAELYNRMVRMIQQGQKLRMAIEFGAQFHDDDPMAYNTVAEIPGTDLKDEVVMLGGHMDSWHSGTGATDNGAGVAVAMEAVRILKTLGLKPRRTIRVGLWSGEEEGLLGSRAYVKEHFGEVEEDPYGEAMTLIFGTPAPPRKLKTKPAYDKFCAYFNLDNGTGKVRGVYMEGNESVRPIFRKWLVPFRDQGATTLSVSPTGGTDHMSFDGIGLPGFQFIQDRIEYESRTHHSNQDVFDRAQADDLKQASVVMATFVYQAATRDEPLPRKPWRDGR